jgi:hypothetical protein
MTDGVQPAEAVDGDRGGLGGDFDGKAASRRNEKTEGEIHAARTSVWSFGGRCNLDTATLPCRMRI